MKSTMLRKASVAVPNQILAGLVILRKPGLTRFVFAIYSKLINQNKHTQLQEKAMSITIPASIARTQLGSLLRQIAQKKTRFVISKGGKPAAVLLGIDDFDDILEELDPEFQKSLRIAANEYRSGKAITLKEYLRNHLAARK